MKRAAKLVIGAICLVLGLLALVTPLTPGGWLTLVGLELLGLGMLLPRVVREPWEKLKMKIVEKIPVSVRRIFGS